MDPLTPTNKPIPPIDPLTPSPTHITTSPSSRPSPETPTKSRDTPTYADLALKCESLEIGWEQKEKQSKALGEQLETQEKQLQTQEKQLQTQEKQLQTQEKQLEIQEKQLEALREQQEKQLEALREQKENQLKGLSKEKGLLLRKLDRVLSSRKSLRVRTQDASGKLKARDGSRQTNTRLLVENKRLQRSLLESLRSNKRVASRPDARQTRLVAALRDELADLQIQHQTLQAERNDVQHQNHQMLAEGKSLIAANNDLTAQLGTANDTIQSLHTFIQGLQAYAEKVVREKFEMELLVEGRLRNLTPKQRNWVRGMLEREEGARGRVKESGSWEGDVRRVVERRRSTGEVGLSKGGLRGAVGAFPAKRREVNGVPATLPGADGLPGPQDVASPSTDQQQSSLSTIAFALLMAVFWVLLFAMVLLAAGTIIIQDRRQIT